MTDKLKKFLPFFVILLIFILLSTVFSGVVKFVNSSFNGITIVIDAGHGGRDGGSVGVGGTIEKEINLKYAYALKDKLTSSGFRVEMTRKTDDGLYSASAKNKKLSDMEARKNIIKRANPNLVISIHMNSFSSSGATGANCYYRQGDESGKQISNLIQQSFNTYCGAKSKLGKVGDYYILNSTYYTAVLVEFGFLSNPSEEALLNTDDYRTKLIDAVYSGIILYFGV